MSDRIRLVIADDHPLFREGVVHTVAREIDMEVVGEAATGEEAVRLACDLLPDVVLLDLAMPGQGGLAAARAIAAACPVTAIIVLTVSEDEEDLMAALKAGAKGYVLKGVAARQLVGVVRAVRGGEVYVAPNMAARVLLEMGQGRSAEPFESLTEREREILELVAAGHTNKEIGARLYLAETTVKYYMTNILEKLHVRSRVEAALLAHGVKLAPPGAS